ncbi:E3 ubiquitin-protein ligase MPSR1 [Linum grandiflorum]
MSSTDSESAELAELFERLMSRHRDFSMFFPFIMGLTRARSEENPETEEEEGEEGERRRSVNSTERMILINPLTQGTVVIEGAAVGGFDSLIRDLFSSRNGGGGVGYGQPPASKASIEGLKTVEDCGNGECVICLDEWEKEGEVVKEMPCKHRFHGGCVEKWLKVHGSCPVCRFQMPVEEEESGKKDGGEEEGEGEGGGRRVEREIWVSFSVGGRRRDSNSNSNSNSEQSGGAGDDAGNGGSGDSTSFESID